MSQLRLSLPRRETSTNEQDLFLNPGTWTSAHHTPMGTGAQYAGDGHPTNVSWQLENFTTLNTGLTNGFGANVFISSPSDPLKTVTVAPGGNGINLPYTMHMPVMQNGNSADAMVVLLDRVGDGHYHEFYGFLWNGGSPMARGRRPYAPDGLLHGPPKLGFGASGQTMMFGLVRGHEVNDDAFGPIMHATNFLARVKTTDIVMANAFQWPAGSVDGLCDGVTTCTGNIKYGSLMAIPQGLSSAGRGLTPLGLRLWDQMRNYGGFVIDGTGGRNSRGDQFVTSAKRTEYIDQMRIIMPLMRYVLNNTQGQTCWGGGSPLAPNGAFDA